MQPGAAGQTSTYSSLAHPLHTAAVGTAALLGCPCQHHALQEEGEGVEKKASITRRRGVTCHPTAATSPPVTCWVW